MMIITLTNLLLCQDCTQAAVNDDYTSLALQADEDKRIAEIQEGLTRLGPGLTWDSKQPDIEFSTNSCDCCRTKLHGRRVPFVILIEKMTKKDYLAALEKSNTLVAAVHNVPFTTLLFSHRSALGLEPIYHYNKIEVKSKGIITRTVDGRQVHRDFYGSNDFYRYGDSLYHVSIERPAENPGEEFTCIFINENRSI